MKFHIFIGGQGYIFAINYCQNKGEELYVYCIDC